MKKLMLSLSLVAGLTSLVACSSKDNKQPEKEQSEIVTTIENPVTIEFWHAMAGTNQEAVEKLVADFNATVGAEKKITVKPVYQGQYTDFPPHHKPGIPLPESTVQERDCKFLRYTCSSNPVCFPYVHLSVCLSRRQTWCQAPRR